MKRTGGPAQSAMDKLSNASQKGSSTTPSISTSVASSERRPPLLTTREAGDFLAKFPLASMEKYRKQNEAGDAKVDSGVYLVPSSREVTAWSTDRKFNPAKMDFVQVVQNGISELRSHGAA